MQDGPALAIQTLDTAVGLCCRASTRVHMSGCHNNQGASLRESVVILYSHTQRSYNLYTVMVWTEAAASSTCTYENAAVTSYRA